jgi:hypothetical protein
VLFSFLSYSIDLKIYGKTKILKSAIEAFQNELIML